MSGDNGGTPKKKCFIVSSIGESNSPERIHLEFYREYILKPVFSNLPDYEFSGSNEIEIPGMIDNQIINHLLEDDLVIADMTFLNANVFYEIGLRHFVRKPIIHTFRRLPGFKIPFDVQSYRAIDYDITRPAEFEDAKARLRAQIEHIESPGFEVDTPITRAISSREVRAHGTDVQNLLLERIEGLEGQVRLLQAPSHIKLEEVRPRLLGDLLPISDIINIQIKDGTSEKEIYNLVTNLNSLMSQMDIIVETHRGDGLIMVAVRGRVDDKLRDMIFSTIKNCSPNFRIGI